MVCVWAPPSDQDWKNTWPLTIVCGDVTLRTCDDLRGTVRVNGTVWALPSTMIETPALFEAKLMSTRFAVSVCFFVFVRPRLSVTVRKIS
jgi:hypothetical protein